MADSDWHYLENQFDNSTRNSKKRMKLLAQRHLNALASAPATVQAALQTRLAQPKADYDEKYGDWRNFLAYRAGAVEVMEELIAKLSGSDIEDIETTFKGVYKRDTPQHTTVFNGGRAPYQEGADEERVDALAQLLERVKKLNDVKLADVVTLITEVLTALQAADADIGKWDAAAEQARTQIEPLRKALAVALYQNMAQLMTELGPSEEVAAFFDLELLRETAPDEEPVVPIPPAAPAA